MSSGWEVRYQGLRVLPRATRCGLPWSESDCADKVGRSGILCGLAQWPPMGKVHELGVTPAGSRGWPVVRCGSQRPGDWGPLLALAGTKGVVHDSRVAPRGGRERDKVEGKRAASDAAAHGGREGGG